MPLRKTHDALKEVVQERANQHEKWGKQVHTPCTWILILGEEMAESAACALSNDDHNYYQEMVQVAAVATAALESSMFESEGDFYTTPYEISVTEQQSALAALKTVGEICRALLENDGAELERKWLRLTMIFLARQANRLETLMLVPPETLNLADD